MELVLNKVFSKEKVKSYLLDLVALNLILFTPAISHLFSFPIYLIEPMRIMLILSVAHTEKRNAYLLAFILPFFSYLISSHPTPFKAGLISIELISNVWMFYYLSGKVKNSFFSMLASVIASKVFYYFLKAILIGTVLLSGELIATPIYLQLIMSLVLSGYIYLIYYIRGKNV